MGTPESSYDDIAKTATLSSGQVIHGFHKSIHCKGEFCPVHNPSNHEFRDSLLHFNFEKFIFERIVEVVMDGVEETHYVPDPDDYNLNLNDGNMVYRNSIRCNQCGDEIESTNRHDMATCSCGAVSVDGGSSYQIIGGEPGSYANTSIMLENWKFVYKEEK